MGPAAPQELMHAWRAAAGHRRMLWRGEGPDGAGGEAFVAWGLTEEVEAQGPHRFAAAKKETARSPGAMPWIGGFGFDEHGGIGTPWEPFSSLRFWRPRGLRWWDGMAWMTRGEEATPKPTQAAAKAAPEWGLACLDKNTWKASVRGALRAIQLKHAQKLVLARATGGPARVHIDSVVEQLLHGPNGTVYAVELEPGTLFVGRSPERLARVDAAGIHTHALAGTPMPGADAEKLKREHDLVVTAIRDGLATLGLKATTTAGGKRTAGNVEHLDTRIEAAGKAHLLDVAAALHPTPAVGASPRDAADMLETLDALQRGWYAGAVGFMDDEGRGEFAVALRSALIVPGASWLFAGAGIVPGSDPEAEYEETEAKLHTMREALRAGPAGPQAPGLGAEAA